MTSADLLSKNIWQIMQICKLCQIELQQNFWWVARCQHSCSARELFTAKSNETTPQVS